MKVKGAAAALKEPYTGQSEAGPGGEKPREDVG